MTVTALYAGILALLYMALTYRVIFARLQQEVDMGDADDYVLRRYIRGHGNFAEYVPLAIVLLLVLEVDGTSFWVLHALGTMLLAGRLLHAWAFSVAERRQLTRMAGIMLTTGMIGLSAILCLVRYATSI